MVVAAHFQSALAEAVNRFPEHQKKWITVMARLMSTYGALGGVYYQSDYRVDLILRALEDEVKDWPEGQFDAVGMDVLVFMSRYWVFSIYEALRIAKNAQAGKADAKLVRL
jgi:hypothetical protein